MIDVLVVDDDFHVAEINAAYVDRVDGFRVIARAHTAQQALTVLRRRPVDLVLLDHYLPDLNGLELVRRMRQYGHPADVMMVTAASDVGTVREALRGGAVHYLVKPFTFTGLRGKLESYASLRRTLRSADGHGESAQARVDRIFGALRAQATEEELPKGHSAPTAELIHRALTGTGDPLSAHDIAERTGVSRSTAQRYLRYLESTGRVQLTLRYGETGRPEHRYGLPEGTPREGNH